MALEVEYVDYGPEEISQEVDAADLVNGDGEPQLRAYSETEEACSETDDCDGAAEQPAGETATEAPFLVVTEPDGTSQPLLEAVGEIQVRPGEMVDLPLGWHINSRPKPPQWMLSNPQQVIEWNEQCDTAERNYQISVAAAKENHTSLAVRRAEMEAELKELKADEKAALKSLGNLIHRGPAYPQPKSKIEEAVAGGGEKSAIQVDDPAADDSWKAISTASIIEGIKGLGQKKADAIVELAPTLGDLEELRAQAGIAHKPFADVLPKGIGRGMADEIEERILDAVAKAAKK